MTVLNGSSNYSNGNSYLAGDVLRDMEPALIGRWMRADTRYR